MFILYFIFFFIGILVFLWMAEFNIFLRIIAAFLVFLIPSISITGWLVKIGDKPPPDAVVIVPKHSDVSENTDSENK